MTRVAFFSVNPSTPLFSPGPSRSIWRRAKNTKLNRSSRLTSSLWDNKLPPSSSLVTVPDMSRKRRNTSSPESDYSPPPKRSRSITSYAEDEDYIDSEEVKEQPRLDPESGLHNAFPGLGTNGDELFYGPAADGIDYLRMVR